MQTKMTDQELDERVARAVDNFMQGYGCCQSVVPASAPELFKKSANVYVRMTEEDVCGTAAYIKNFQVEDLENFKAE